MLGSSRIKRWSEPKPASKLVVSIMLGAVNESGEQAGGVAVRPLVDSSSQAMDQTVEGAPAFSYKSRKRRA